MNIQKRSCCKYKSLLLCPSISRLTIVAAVVDDAVDTWLCRAAGWQIRLCVQWSLIFKLASTTSAAPSRACSSLLTSRTPVKFTSSVWWIQEWMVRVYGVLYTQIATSLYPAWNSLKLWSLLLRRIACIIEIIRFGLI